MDPLEVDSEGARLSFIFADLCDIERRRRKLTYRQVAETAGVSRSMVSDFLNGHTNPTLKTCAKIELACGCRFRITTPKVFRT